MEQKLLSICIPTWNRASVLERTLNNIISQALEFKDKVEICISNNGSTDNTKEVVMKFKEKHPEILIKYNENERNLGPDKNLLKAIDMAEGDFAWTSSDDDSIANNGVKEVINFLERIKDKNVGVVLLNAQGSYFDEEKNAMRLTTGFIDENTLGDFEMGAEDAVNRLDSGGISVLIFNNKLLKKIFRESYELVEKGIGLFYMHTWLYFLIFVLDESRKRYLLEKPVVTGGWAESEPYYIKNSVEREFLFVYYVITMFDMLQSITTNTNFISSFNKLKRHAKIDFIYTRLALYKAFNKLNYISYFSCIRLFFSCLKFIDALLFSLSFMIISIAPSFILRGLCKTAKKIKYGEQADYLLNRTTAGWHKVGKEKRIRIGKKG